jgi:hypothetical protein
LIVHECANDEKAVYGLEGRLTSGFIPAIRTALRELAAIASDIQAYFPIPADHNGAISRVAATLHLTYHHVSFSLTCQYLYRPLMRLDHESVSL